MKKATRNTIKTLSPIGVMTVGVVLANWVFPITNGMQVVSTLILFASGAVTAHIATIWD